MFVSITQRFILDGKLWVSRQDHSVVGNNHNEYLGVREAYLRSSVGAEGVAAARPRSGPCAPTPARPPPRAAPPTPLATSAPRPRPAPHLPTARRHLLVPDLQRCTDTLLLFVVCCVLLLLLKPCDARLRT